MQSSGALNRVDADLNLLRILLLNQPWRDSFARFLPLMRPDDSAVICRQCEKCLISESIWKYIDLRNAWLIQGPTYHQLNIFHSLPSQCVFLPSIFYTWECVCVGTGSVCKHRETPAGVFLAMIYDRILISPLRWLAERRRWESAYRRGSREQNHMSREP